MKWNKLLLVVTCALILSVSGTAQSQPQPPVLSVVISGTWIDLSWTPVQGATGYTLSFAPIPFTGIASIGTADMGTQTSLSGYLWVGAAYYVAIQSRDGSGLSPYSNILEVVINPSPLSGNFQVFAFNDLGMHCYDPDFSVFSILPLFNVLHAQVVQKGSYSEDHRTRLSRSLTRPRRTGPDRSIRPASAKQISGSMFWPCSAQTLRWMKDCWEQKCPDSMNQPQPFSWEGGTTKWFAAAGIPITALDDSFKINSYPLMNVQALDPANAAVLSSLARSGSRIQ